MYNKTFYSRKKTNIAKIKMYDLMDFMENSWGLYNKAFYSRKIAKNRDNPYTRFLEESRALYFKTFYGRKKQKE